MLWSRKVFTFAEEQFLVESQKYLRGIQNSNKKDKKSKQKEPDLAQKIEFDYKAHKKVYNERNGGILGINFLFKQLYRALFGQETHSINDKESQKDSVHYHVGSIQIQKKRSSTDRKEDLESEDSSPKKQKVLVACSNKD